MHRATLFRSFYQACGTCLGHPSHEREDNSFPIKYLVVEREFEAIERSTIDLLDDRLNAHAHLRRVLRERLLVLRGLAAESEAATSASRCRGRCSTSRAE